MTQARLHTYTGGLTIIVVALALLNWNFAPESANPWIAALITMPLIWLIAGLKMKYTKRYLNDIELKFFVSTVILAGLLLAFSLAAKLIGNLYDIDPTLIKRVREVFLGVVMLYIFNLMPKMIGPRLQGKWSNAAANSLRRFSAWVLVLGALGYIGAWIFAPFSQASNIAHWCVGVAVIIVVLRILFAMLMGRRIPL